MREETANESEWLSLHQASDSMGVSPATLRAWANVGRVPSFRTPGGHRRFRRSDVLALTETGQGQPERRWDMLEHSALGRTRLALDASGLVKETWFKKANRQIRAGHRELGRKLVRLLVDALRDGAMEADARACALGREYARLHRRQGLALADAVAAFTFFRSSFLESVREFWESIGDLKMSEVLSRYQRLNQVIDRVLVAMIEDYEQVKGQ